METEVYATAEEAAHVAAELIYTAADTALQHQERFAIAFSGGRSPALMLETLAGAELPWAQIDVFQVDERIAPSGDAARNLTGLIDNLAARVALPAGNLHPMPVEGDNLAEAAIDYQRLLVEQLGLPPILDLVHLGLGADGHIASLVPGDPALLVDDRDVAVTQPYQGRQRLTLTYPMLNRARRILYLVTGADKKDAIARLMAGDPTIPAGRLRQDNALLILDEAARP